MQSENLTSSLLDMGFTQEQATVAVKHSTDKTLEGLVVWITSHPNLEEFIDKEPPTEAIQVEGQAGAQPEEPQGKSIAGLVNQEMASGIEAMGYSKNVREKALLMTQNVSIEAALEWIEQHKDDADFEEELLLVQDDNKPKMSTEEALEKAKQLQERIRENRRKRDAEEELERERSRISGGKAMTEAKRQMEEQQRARDVEIVIREKKEDEVARQKILDQLENDRRARFGDKYVSIAAVQKEKSPVEQIQFGLKQMKTVYPPWTHGEQLKVCWNTIKTVLNNIVKNPEEPKFQNINSNNPNFKARVVDIIGGVFILQQCGFVDEAGTLVLKKKDLELFKEVSALLEKEIHNMN